MPSLSDEDIEKLFSGAPQYFARSQGHFSGAPNPSVAFPWDEALKIRDLTDHAQIDDGAFGCVTAWPHITRRRRRDRTESSAGLDKRRAHFNPKCRERPNMLSMQGLEKGTTGYQAALEMAVSDALQEEQFGFDSMGTKANVIVEARHRLLTTKDGLRHLEETAILDQLIKNGQRYQQDHLRNPAVSNTLYSELFLHILHPPTRVVDHQDPYSLSVQIQALLKTLAAPNVWVDFSHVEWRIRLGQILWGTDIADGIEDGASIKDAETTGECHEERCWLLLQILLACELLIRLDAVTEGDELGTGIRPSEVHRFEKEANSSVKWSLHLARAWLQNIEVTKVELPGDGGPPRQTGGWLATLTRRMSLAAGHASPGLPSSHHYPGHPRGHGHDAVYAMRGKYGERQVEGLTHFARRLRWPHIEACEAQIAKNCQAVTEGTPLNTPVATPLTIDAPQRSSYFGGSRGSREIKRMPPSRRRNIAAALHPSGWLSKSYVSGLMLPGEGLCHIIMSTLLENDREAMAKLGPRANLCGGFVYGGKSFWSTACIVGRVLAAGKGSAECMGWISSDVTPEGLADSWVKIKVQDVPEDVQRTGNRARLWGKLALERESSVLGDKDPSSVLPADFIIPFENMYKETPPPSLHIELTSLGLSAPVDSVQTTPTEEKAFPPLSEAGFAPQIHTYPAEVAFSVIDNGTRDEKEETFSLANDVQFVTAHPCVPSQRVRILKSPSSPTIQQIDLTGSGLAGNSSSSAALMGHPLHKYYTYTPIHLSQLLVKRHYTLDQLLSNYDAEVHPEPTEAPPTWGTSSRGGSRLPPVLVVDCITGFQPLPQAHEIPISPVATHNRTWSGLESISSIETFEGADRTVTASPVTISPSSPQQQQQQQQLPQPRRAGTSGELADASSNGSRSTMHSETRRRQFGSDMEMLVRALCAEKGWNALISRRRRGCLACAIREAGALGWKVVIRVD